MEYKLNKQICLITGASSGIGAKTASLLSNESEHIYIVGRNIESLEITHDTIVKNNCNCTIVPLDITKDGVLNELAKNIYKKDGRIDILVSSAGIIEHLSPIDSIDESLFKKIVELNFISNFKLIKSFHYLLKQSEDARVLVVSYLAKKIANQYWGIYQPIMHALNELIITYAVENKNSNIKANLLCPGAVDTPFRNKIMPGEDKSNLLTVNTVAKKILELTQNNLIETGKIYTI